MLAASGAATWDFGPLTCDGCNLPRLRSSASLGHECNALIYERGGEGCSFLQVGIDTITTYSKEAPFYHCDYNT